MPKKIIFIILGLFGVISLLIVITTWHLKKLEKSLSEIGIPKFEIVKPKNLEELLNYLKGEKTSGEIQYKEFISPDGRLKIKYPFNWIEIEDETILEKIFPKEEVEELELRNLFLAQEFRGGRYAQLKVYEKAFKEESIESIVTKMKEINQKHGWEMEIIESEIKDKEATFEAKYQKPDRLPTHSKEKVVIFEPEKKVYFIVFLAFEKDWEGVKEEASSIIDSIQIIE